ncbi:hypothetical protein CTA1_12224 [Colletotrichum tanaceti]|uniref:Uncharacterized protein n=1 Tax=Colletotrichum tanaceti TaxID=1306861 RepID=A0A4U6X7V0_9PEZI|nr:hypothetical protein CTA1_12224 [Colletotrichum tanaceti]
MYAHWYQRPYGSVADFPQPQWRVGRRPLSVRERWIGGTRAATATTTHLFGLVAPELVPDLGVAELPGVPPQHRRPLLDGHPDLLAHRHETPRQVHVVLAQQPDRHHEVVNVVEDERLLADVRLLLLEERRGMVAPVPARVEVVRRDAGAKVRVRLVGVDEGVLAPVADHQAQAEQQQRAEEDKGGGAAVEAVQGAEDGVVAELPEGRLPGVAQLALAEEVARQVEPDEEEEAGDVAEEVEGVVALVADGGGQVVGPVALDVVVLDVVVEVGVPGVAHEGVGDVGEGGVEGPQEAAGLPGEDAAHVDVLVHHEGVGADVVELHGHVQRAVDVAETAEQQQGARHGGGQVEEQVGEHQDVGLVADDAARPGHVRQDDVPVEGGGDPGRQPSSPSAGARCLSSYRLMSSMRFWRTMVS